MRVIIGPDEGGNAAGEPPALVRRAGARDTFALRSNVLARGFGVSVIAVQDRNDRTPPSRAGRRWRITFPAAYLSERIPQMRFYQALRRFSVLILTGVLMVSNVLGCLAGGALLARLSHF